MAIDELTALGCIAEGAADPDKVITVGVPGPVTGDPADVIARRLIFRGLFVDGREGFLRNGFARPRVLVIGLSECLMHRTTRQHFKAGGHRSNFLSGGKAVLNKRQR